MKHIILLFLGLLALSLTHPFQFSHPKINPTNPCPPWPPSFSITFNATVLQFGIIGAPSVLYYDYTQKAQRIDFSLCAATGKFNPCTVLFTATDVYTIENQKCSVQKGIGTLPPDWTKILTFNRTSLAFGQKGFFVELFGRSSSLLFY